MNEAKKRSNNVGRQHEVAAPIKPVNGVTSMTTDIKHVTNPKASHTPGPWRVDATKGSMSYVRAASGEAIASCSWKHGQQDVPAIANARLIAAAPKLLEALEKCLERLEWAESEGLLQNFSTTRQAHAAIGQAKGLAA